MNQCDARYAGAGNYTRPTAYTTRDSTCGYGTTGSLDTSIGRIDRSLFGWDGYRGNL